MLGLVFFGCSLLSAVGSEPQAKGHYGLTGVEVYAVDRSQVDGIVHDAKSDSLTHWVRFDFRAETVVAKETADKNFRIVSPTDSTKSSLTFNKAIEFQGHVVPAGTNLLTLKRDGKFPAVRLPSLHPLAVQSLHLSDGFVFAPDTYTLNFQWELKDGQMISDTVKVKIDLKKGA